MSASRDPKIFNPPLAEPASNFNLATFLQWDNVLHLDWFLTDFFKHFLSVEFLGSPSSETGQPHIRKTIHESLIIYILALLKQ